MTMKSQKLDHIIWHKHFRCCKSKLSISFLVYSRFFILFLFFAGSLEEINLGDCSLKTRGATNLSHALKSEHFNLKRIVLDHNEIGADGGYLISKAIINKRTFKLLDLNGNKVNINKRHFNYSYLLH